MNKHNHQIELKACDKTLIDLKLYTDILYLFLREGWRELIESEAGWLSIWTTGHVERASTRILWCNLDSNRIQDSHSSSGDTTYGFSAWFCSGSRYEHIRCNTKTKSEELHIISILMAFHLLLVSAIVNENRCSVATVSLEFLKSKVNWSYCALQHLGIGFCLHSRS